MEMKRPSYGCRKGIEQVGAGCKKSEQKTHAERICGTAA